jgi:hypothetical protein
MPFVLERMGFYQFLLGSLYVSQHWNRFVFDSIFDKLLIA